MPGLCLDCTDLCGARIQILQRESDHSARVCGLCADLGSASADECGPCNSGEWQRWATACRECGEACRQMAARVVMDDNEQETLRVEVDNLHCEGCAETLRESLADLPGVGLHRVDVERRCLLIELDHEETSRDELGDALQEAGFPATSVVVIEEGEEAEPSPPRRAAPYALLVLALLFLGAVGYAGYELYPRFDLPPAEGATLLLLAVGAGIASFFSPCAFGLLVTLLARESGGEEDRPRLARAMRFATGVSLGACVFVLGTGAVIALGGSGLVSGVTFTSTAGRALRLAVGVFLVLLGLVQLELLPHPLHRAEDWTKPLQRLSARERRERPFWGYTLFGFGYLLAGFG